MIGMTDIFGSEEPQSLAGAVSGVLREDPNLEPGRKELVKFWHTEVAAARKQHRKAFKRMREDMDFAYKNGVGEQWENQTENDDRYQANIVQRHIGARVSSLYAKNPRVTAKRREKLDFRVWDGSMDKLTGAIGEVQQAAQMGTEASMQALMMLEDVKSGMDRRRMYERIGKTCEIIFHYSINEQIPGFKRQMKQLVRRIETCGVAYIRPGYQRLMQKKPEIEAKIADVTQRIQAMDRIQADLVDGEIDQSSREAEELKLMLQDLMKEQEVIIREGLTFDFPLSTRILPDKRCKQIQGFVGSRWVGEEFVLSPEEVKEIYKVDLKNKYRRVQVNDYEEVIEVKKGDPDYENGEVCVIHIYDRKTRLVYKLADGYSDFLEEPKSPDIRVEEFIPLVAVAFNEIEHEKDLFPPSDVRLLRHPQREYNRNKEALRQHRIANRPLYASPRGALEEEDQVSLEQYPAHAVIMLDGLKEGQSVDSLLQPVKKVAVDPNIYETEQTFTDIQRIVGTQEANLGGTSGASATEVSVGEGARMSSLASNVDDLDDALTIVAKMASQIMLREMSKETVIEIAGPGAVWPEFNSEDIVKEVWLEIIAGSSGKPNRAQALANFERVAPYLLQIPGIKPDYLGRKVLEILDDSFDLDEAIVPDLPSITALNGFKQVGTGNALTDPNQQGGNGRNNAPTGDRKQPGPQASYPAADAAVS